MKPIVTAALILILVCPPVAATGVTGTRITKVLAHRNGYATITVANPAALTLPCDTTFPPRAGDNHYAFDMTSNAGKALYAAAVLAYSTQSFVDVLGTNSCFNYVTGPLGYGAENLASVRLVP